ncbi:hypothetical protein EMPS_11490 [Entomortierella parvispora]|uniref:Uncharacterized protein n=1 Tax=Entomortierella parvispora TaxID=205924 RepID=A0A9P3HM90_9FUNG|nr:hypothetical protein EMPS_11490 [Entomortierella parvispora]
MSTDTADAYGISPPPVEINAIVPGSIFQDDITPPTFTDGNGNDPVAPVSGEPTTPSSANGVGGKAPDIEVSPTIQTVLISLGIVVGVLFLLGVVATHYITHKNKRAEQKKKRLSEMPEGGDEKGVGGLGGLKADDEKSELVTVMIDDYDTKQKKQKSSPPSSTASNSPKGGIIGGVGTAVGTSAAAATRVGLHDNARNSFMEVAQVYSRRQSITPTPLPPQSAMTSSDSSNFLGTSSLIRSAGPGYSQQHGSPELQIGIYPHSSQNQQTHPFQQQLQQQFSPFLPDQNSPHFPISPSSAGTMDESQNPFASPPLSAGLQDPFRTQNNSQVDLTLGLSLTSGSSSSGSRGGPTPSTSSTSLSSSAQTNVMDRRLVGNSTPSPPTVIANKFSPGAFSSSPQGPGATGATGSTNEGNAWYRKRNSIIIPDSASAHVRLWRDDGEETSNSPLSKSPRLQRPRRSGSHSSTTAPLGISTSPSSSSIAPGAANGTTAPSPLHNASRWSPSSPSDQSQTYEDERQERNGTGGGGLEAKASTVSRNGAAVFEGRAKLNTTLDNDMSLTPRTPTTPRVPLLVEPEAEKSREGGEPSEEVVVRLRTNRRGSHSSHRQSYLDDLQQQ